MRVGRVLRAGNPAETVPQRSCSIVLRDLRLLLIVRTPKLTSLYNDRRRPRSCVRPFLSGRL
jgi:hypothetical protein